MNVLYVLGYFNRNKQNSYAALNLSLLRCMLFASQHCQPVPPPVDKLPIEKTGEAPV